MKIKRIATSILAVACTGMVCGQNDGYRKVWVALSDGSQIEVQLSKTLETSFAEDQVTFSDGETNYSFPKEIVKSFKFDQSPLSIGSTNREEGSCPIIGEGSIKFSELPANSHVTLMDLNGKTYLETIATGRCTLTLPKLPKGAYIVNVNSMSYKIIIK